jgi:tRNA-uridine 2-sulfurtransferase
MSRAVALVSTGLDSLLAVRVVRDMGVDVLGLHCSFRFGAVGDERLESLEENLRPLGVPLEVLDITEPFIEVMRNPAHGFGSCVNPCIDCHLFMLMRAKEAMERTSADFVVTGEVVGQRPMSQNRPTLFHIEKLAGLAGRIVRPLSAQCLPPTIAEQNGWVDRNRMHGIAGRGRREQEALAALFGITRYAQPAGGCILTDPFYAKRVKAFIRNRGQAALTTGVLSLCRLGRHFWIDDRLWVVVGRDERDNDRMEASTGGRWRLEALDIEGPLVLADGADLPDDLPAAASVLARYANKRKTPELRIAATLDGGQPRILSAGPSTPETLARWQV